MNCRYAPGLRYRSGHHGRVGRELKIIFGREPRVFYYNYAPICHPNLGAMCLTIGPSTLKLVWLPMLIKSNTGNPALDMS